MRAVLHNMIRVFMALIKAYWTPTSSRVCREFYRGFYTLDIMDIMDIMAHSGMFDNDKGWEPMF